MFEKLADIIENEIAYPLKNADVLVLGENEEAGLLREKFSGGSSLKKEACDIVIIAGMEVSELSFEDEKIKLAVLFNCKGRLKCRNQGMKTVEIHEDLHFK